MSDNEPIVLFGSERPASVAQGKRQSKSRQYTVPSQIAFNRRELDQILRVYGRKVADGEWRDYAIDALREKAVFSIFRRSAEMPLYRIEKQPRLSRKQGAYSVVAVTGLILGRGHDLSRVLRAVDRKPRLVVA